MPCLSPSARGLDGRGVAFRNNFFEQQGIGSSPEKVHISIGLMICTRTTYLVYMTVSFAWFRMPPTSVEQDVRCARRFLLLGLEIPNEIPMTERYRKHWSDELPVGITLGCMRPMSQQPVLGPGDLDQTFAGSSGSGGQGEGRTSSQEVLKEFERHWSGDLAVVRSCSNLAIGFRGMKDRAEKYSSEVQILSTSPWTLDDPYRNQLKLECLNVISTYDIICVYMGMVSRFRRHRFDNFCILL